MGQSRKTNFILIIVFLVLVTLFARSYNQSITVALSNTTSSDKEMLYKTNDEIIKKLRKSDSTKQWKEIICEYKEISFVIEDNENNVVISSEDKVIGSVLDVNVRTAFEYKGNAYLITSSVYLLRDYRNAVLKFAVTQVVLICAVIGILSVLVYAIIIRPYKRFYDAIAEYERTGRFEKMHFRGYIGKIYDRFGKMTKSLNIQQENQRRIIASISHDIKTPLTSIMGYAERLKKDNISPERREKYINTVYNKSLEIRSLVDEFDEYLGYNMLKNFMQSYVTLDELCKLLKDEYSDELESLGIDFDIYCPDSNAGVMIDTSKMKRVFGNIIANSVKHFTDAEKKIKVSIYIQPKNVFIRFSDSGEGVADEKLELIFEPLYTSDRGRKVAGLGLAICREIVESHGGKIYAQKSELGGLAVCIELPKEKYRNNKMEQNI